MSGILSNNNENKKRSKSKKSVKVKSNKLKSRFRKNAKSEGNLFTNKTCENSSDEADNESKLETHILKKIKHLTLSNQDETNVASTSAATISDKESGAKSSDESPIAGSSLDYKAELYRDYPKKTKSIKFTNQVTVLHFNRNNELCESMEPIKREEEQQLRNKEMRQDHLLKMGHEMNNVYLF